MTIKATKLHEFCILDGIPGFHVTTTSVTKTPIYDANSLVNAPYIHS